MADSKDARRESREVEWTKVDGMGIGYKRVGCGNDACYCTGDCRVDVKGTGDASPGDITLKIDVDVSEALTGLKAVQREAREATKALRELETYYESEGKRFYVKWSQSDDDECTNIREVCLSDVPTTYLERELSKRGQPEVSE